MMLADLLTIENKIRIDRRRNNRKPSSGLQKRWVLRSMFTNNKNNKQVTWVLIKKNQNAGSKSLAKAPKELV